MDAEADSTFPNWPELRRIFTYDNLVGKVVQGRYEVLRRLGAGGMGVVFLARHVHLDKLFALKIISPRFLDEPEIARRFLHEARAASKIDHPNVVNITDFGPPEEGPAFFAMEYLEGEDLARTLAREGPLPWPRALAIAAQVARALAAAHQRGVIHRDIKPQNCLRLARDDNPDFIKVLDFGLAKVLSGTGKSAWTVGGSPGYIAPEVYKGGKTDHRVDIFALGVLLHTLLVGRLPAQAPGDVELPPGAPVLHASELPAPLQALLRRATDDDPERRFPTALALLAAIEAARDELLRPPAPAQSPPAPRRRWPLAAALGACTLLAGLAAAARLGATQDMSSRAGLGDPDASHVPDALSMRPGLTGQPETSPGERPADPAGPPSPDPSPAVVGQAGAGGEEDAAPRRGPAGPTETSLAADPQDMSDRSGPQDPPAPAPGRRVDPRPGGKRVPAPFDEPAARTLLQRQAAAARACKAESSFRGVAATLRLGGTVTVSPRGAATLALPPGYDIAPCLERLVAGLRFQPSAEGGAFAYTFLL